MLVNDVHLPRNEGQPCAATFLTPLCMFCLGSVGLCLLVRPHRACCVLYRHNALAFFGAAGDQHFLKNVCQWPTFLGKCLSMTNISLKNVCQWPTFLEKCLSMTDISWKMSVNHQHIGSWLMTFIFPCTLTHPYECFSFKVCVCDLLVGLTRRSISPRLFSLPRLTNISWKMSVIDPHFCSKCWSMMFVCPDTKDNHVLHFFSPFAWKVWVCLCLCVLTGHAVFFIDIARWLFLVPRETKICWKMSVNDQHFSENVCQWPTFLKNVCEWPTFLEKCLSMTDISWKMSVDHHHISTKLWWMTFIFPCTLSHLYECFLWKSACVILWSV